MANLAFVLCASFLLLQIEALRSRRSPYLIVDLANTDPVVISEALSDTHLDYEDLPIKVKPEPKKRPKFDSNFLRTSSFPWAPGIYDIPTLVVYIEYCNYTGFYSILTFYHYIRDIFFSGKPGIVEACFSKALFSNKVKFLGALIFLL